LIKPGVPGVRGTAQNGHAAWNPDVPHGRGTSVQYLTVLSEAM